MSVKVEGKSAEIVTVNKKMEYAVKNPDLLADKIIAGLIEKLNSGQGSSILNSSSTGSYSKLLADPRFIESLEAAYNRQRQFALSAVKNLPFKALYRNLGVIQKLFGSEFISNEFLLSKAIEENESSDFIQKMIEKYTGKDTSRLKFNSPERFLAMSSEVSLGALSEKLDKMIAEDEKEEKDKRKKEQIFGMNVATSEIVEKYGIPEAEIPEVAKKDDTDKTKNEKTFGLNVASKNDEKSTDMEKLENAVAVKKTAHSTNPFKA